jgi:CBS domain-containing protein
MSQTIRAAAPHIFKRPVLRVGRDASMLEVATFLAVGPQIYADGLLVFDGARLAGRIGGWSLANHILEKKEKWLQGSAADVMEPFDSPLDADGPLSSALEVFTATRFAFVPVAVKGEVAAFLCARDLLGAVSSTRKVAELASQVIAVSGDMNVPDAIKFMVEKGIRNLVVRNGAGRFANDRKVLEYMLSYEVRKLAAKGGFGALAQVTISDVGLTQGVEISPGTTAKEAARVMAGTNPPCLFVQDMILTPWDLVMK